MNEQQSLCINIEPLLDAFRDKELNETELASVESHLGSCLSCQGKLQDIEKIVGALKELPRLELKVDYADDLDKLLSKGQPGKVIAFRKPAVWQTTIAAAAAVALVIVAGQYFTRSNVLVAQKPEVQKLAQDRTADLTSNAQSPVNSEQANDLALNNKANNSEPVTEILGNQQPIPSGSPQVATNNANPDATSIIASKNANTSIEENSLGSAEDGPDAIIALVDSDHKTASEAIGIETDEDGLYALKL